MYITAVYYPNYISHHGIKGQHWGIRRYQNEDGTYTAEGKARRSANLTKDYKSTKESGMKSKNKYLGRKFLATRKQSTSRGEELDKAGMTYGKATLRSVGRGIGAAGIGTAISTAVSFAATAAISTAALPAGAVLGGISAYNALYAVGNTAYSLSSATRYVQDMRDLYNYKNSQDK